MDMQNHYDNAGNLVNSGSAGHVFVYDALSQVVNVDQGNTASYTYNGMDERVAKKTPTGWTDYAYLNGQPMAEESNRGVWTDYIYANGKKIARVSTMASLLHLHGYRDQTNASCGVEGAISGANLAGLTIVDGDALVYDSQQTLATYGGVALIFTDGTGTGVITDVTTQQPLYFNGQNDGQWHHMAADLSQFAGETVDYVEAGIHNTADMGTFDMAIANVAVVHANATVTNIATSTSTVQNFNGNQCGGQQLTADAGLSPVSALVGTYYYVDDHLGTAQMEFNSSGFTTWQGQFTPYGQEVINGTAYPFAGYVPEDGTTMPFKFTGKERDNESGLDDFGARYYASNMGRWMSPDWSATADPVPYARMDNPQSLNLYAYVGNNPLGSKDGDGHHQECSKSSSSSTDSNGNIHVTVTEHCTEVSDLPWLAMAVPAGHHFIPQSISRNWNDLSRGLANRMTSGPLVDKWRNYYDSLHRAYNVQVKSIVEDYLAETGKTAKQLSVSDVKAIMQRIKSAGGAAEDFGDRLAADASPTLRNAEQALEHGMQESGLNDTVNAVQGAVGDPAGAVEEAIQACESGGCPP